MANKPDQLRADLDSSIQRLNTIEGSLNNIQQRMLQFEDNQRAVLSSQQRLLDLLERDRRSSPSPAASEAPEQDRKVAEVTFWAPSGGYQYHFPSRRATLVVNRETGGERWIRHEKPVAQFEERWPGSGGFYVTDSSQEIAELRKLAERGEVREGGPPYQVPSVAPVGRPYPGLRQPASGVQAPDRLAELVQAERQAVLEQNPRRVEPAIGLEPAEDAGVELESIPLG